MITSISIKTKQQRCENKEILIVGFTVLIRDAFSTAINPINQI